ncbi:UvrD-helicase domain-containing protein [Dyadobacter pollutisoli]|uniref:AAA family ATPase n=1 Tax=Dyadobacter pollutisoli TaxID=2910158 RepID=A0A9E8SPG2_9BACT|nr:UvrD-helicase domain-containing protein [Dyadobacter pollutisoli]WAC11867.1 AAA family ATPase [Dyadobacter pollutisoli]
MADEGLEPEVVSIFEHIDKGENFLLSGGAGSGKTYSLVQVIRTCIERYPYSKVACMTYTNAAVKEIERRIDNKNLNVTTIHDFLWDNIKSFQKDIKKALVSLLNSEDSKIKSPDGAVGPDFFDHLPEGIQYKEWTRVKDGHISHDEVIELAHEMFKSNKLLCDILKDRFQFVFLDEYQDTHPLVVKVLLEHLQVSKKQNIIGFFGDSMQSIYDDSVGDLNAYIVNGSVKEVKKEQNRRNPNTVIDLANKLRSDGLQQRPSTDTNAPNMEAGVVVDGNIKFVYSNGQNLDDVKKSIAWDFTDVKQTKELNLTHNLIAPRAGFATLMEIYDGDKILDFKRRVTDYIKDEQITTDFSAYTFGEVIDELGVTPTAGQQTFIDDNIGLFNTARDYPHASFSKIYVDKEALIDDKKHDEQDENKKGSKRDALIKHLFKIELNIQLYQENRCNEFLRRTEFKVTSVADKIKLKENIEALANGTVATIGEVIDLADAVGICKKDDKLARFIDKNEYLYKRIANVNYSEFRKLYSYLEGQTPFSTQHKIKGEEFENVLIVLDNGGWNKYNFQYLLHPDIFNGLTPAKKKSYPGILSRTQKIFYVCCTRAKKNLVVYYDNPDDRIVQRAKEWFGDANVREVK